MQKLKKCRKKLSKLSMIEVFPAGKIEQLLDLVSKPKNTY